MLEGQAIDQLHPVCTMLVHPDHIGYTPVGLVG